MNGQWFEDCAVGKYEDFLHGQKSHVYLRGYDFLKKRTIKRDGVFRCVSFEFNHSDRDVHVKLKCQALGSTALRHRGVVGHLPVSAMLTAPYRSETHQHTYRHIAEVVHPRLLAVNAGEVTQGGMFQSSLEYLTKSWIVRRASNGNALGLALSDRGIEVAVLEMDVLRGGRNLQGVYREFIPLKHPVYATMMPEFVGIYDAWRLDNEESPYTAREDLVAVVESVVGK